MRDTAMRKKTRLTPNPECYSQNDFGKLKLGKRELGKRELWKPLQVIGRKFSSLNLNTARLLGNIFSSFTPSEIFVNQTSFSCGSPNSKKELTPEH